jgi:ABC-2 type transport system permease protein
MSLRIGPVIYDLKRSFLRISVIIILALAVMAGVGITYLIYVSMASQYSLEDMNFIGELIIRGDSIRFLGVLFDSRGDPISNARIQIFLGPYRGEKEIAEVKTDDNGLVDFKTNISLTTLYQNISPGSSQPIASSPSCKIKIIREASSTEIQGSPSFSLSASGLGSLSCSFFKNSIYTLNSGPQPMRYFRSNVSLYENIFISYIVLKREKENLVVGLFSFVYNADNDSIKPLNKEIYYNITSFERLGISQTIGPVTVITGASVNETTLRSLRFVSAGFVKNYFDVVTISLSKLSLDLVRGPYYLFIKVDDYDYIVFSLFNMYSPATVMIVTSYPGNIGIAFFLFTITILYLSYFFMARPRSSGELEYILSKPLTRDDLFITRYLSQLLTLIIMMSIFIFSLYTTQTILLKTAVEPNIMIMIFVGALTSLIAFLSLMYSIATSLRSGFYLGVSIALYMIFVIFWGAISYMISFAIAGGDINKISEIYQNMYYFNPSIMFQYTVYEAISIVTGSKNNYSLTFVILSSVIWITLPLLIGFIRFRKINLSS